MLLKKTIMSSRWRVNSNTFPGTITRYKPPVPTALTPETMNFNNISPPRSQSPVQIEENNLIQDIASLNTLSIRFDKFQVILSAPVIDLVPLRKLAWGGIPGTCFYLSQFSIVVLVADLINRLDEFKYVQLLSHYTLISK